MNRFVIVFIAIASGLIANHTNETAIKIKSAATKAFKKEIKCEREHIKHIEVPIIGIVKKELVLAISASIFTALMCFVTFIAFKSSKII